MLHCISSWDHLPIALRPSLAFRATCLAILLGLLLVSLVAQATVAADAPQTLRVDYSHSGTAMQDHYALDRVVVEPLPWPGSAAQAIDHLRRGAYFFEVVDPNTGALLYSRGFSSIFGEWQTTVEAQRMERRFSESLRFPMPTQPVRIRLYARDDRNQFSQVWTLDIDPAALDVQRVSAPPAGKLVNLRDNGAPADKVDLLILGDGYTVAEQDKFIADAKRLSDALFTVPPFKQRATDFNVRALMVPSAQSGVARPSSGLQRWTPLGTRYDAFGSERYVLTFENEALRNIAQWAPYEFIEILVNNETYGGGGIYGLYSTAAAGSDWAPYLMVHEFGHHFAGLADEYYTSAVAYQAPAFRREPWEPNVTALHDPSQLKWLDRVRAGTPLPTPWPKAAFDAHQKKYQAVRADFRKQQKPESAMNALFRKELTWVENQLEHAKYAHAVGAFEGANYAASGYYRPEANCIMFTRTDHFCSVCSAAIEAMIDTYSTPKRNP